jgi:transcriptional regulator GlxA family with amidase domain
MRTPRTAWSQPIDVVFVVLPDTLLLDLAGPAEAFRLANQHLAQQGLGPAFAMQFVGPQVRVSSSVGIELAALSPLPPTLPKPSWVVLMGRPGDASMVAARTPWWLRTRDWLGQVLGSDLVSPTGQHRLLTVCVGALLAADAGLLHARQITTHHELLEGLAALAPTAVVVPNRVMVIDGNVATSAGVTTGIDLALHGIEQVCGAAVALAVARVMVAHARRTEHDPQASPLLQLREHLHPALHRLQDAVTAQPQRDWSVQALADQAHVTQRHVTRLFQEHLHTTPRRYVEQLRVALAVHALQRGATTHAVASAVGFATERQMRQALVRANAAGTASLKKS